MKIRNEGWFHWVTVIVSTLLFLQNHNRCLVYGLAGGNKKRSGGRNNNNKRNTASSSTNRGFGAPPPKLEEVVKKFATCIPSDTTNCECPCGSSKPFQSCCAPLLYKERKCESMTDVLRSRYTAFAWRYIPHIIETTHESCRDYRANSVVWAQDLNKSGMFDSFHFVSLKILSDDDSSSLLEEKKNGIEGFMDFEVTLQAKDQADVDNVLSGKQTAIREKSRFLFDSKLGTWSYAGGDVRSQVAGLEDTTLNT